MQEPDGCSPDQGAPTAAPRAALRKTASGAYAALQQFWRNNTAAGTTVLAISTAVAGLVLLLIVLLIGADNERSVELRATQYAGGPQKPRLETSGPTPKQIDALRWIRTATFGVTAVGLLAMATCVMYQRRSPRRSRVENWPRPCCSLPHRHDAKRWQAIRTALGANATELVGNRLTVRQVMSATTPLAAPNTSIRALKTILATRPMSLVAICDPAGHLLGVVGDVDIRRRRGRCAADVMTHNPYTAPPGARLDAAVTLMLDNQIHCLPIVENGILRGMLGASELMTALDCVLQAIHEVSNVGVSCGANTLSIHSQETKHFPPAPARQDEPPDTMTASASG